jgi:hypothetical protein
MRESGGLVNPKGTVGDVIVLTREQHCGLAGLDVEAFKTLHRYGRVPQIRRFAQPGGYHPLETLALAVALQFQQQFFISHQQAASIASRLEVILPHWKNIVEWPTIETEILFGRAYFAFPTSPTDVCGSLARIAADHPSSIGLICLSISRSAAVMKIKAERLGVDLSEFWATPDASLAVKKSTRPQKRKPSK